MAKRFTDTDKYKKTFMRSLPGRYKLFWDYLYHECNHAGIWHVDFEVAQIYVGKDMPIDQDEALALFNKNEERISILSGGRKWFIKPFIEFQYRVPMDDLNPANKAHASILAILKREGLIKPLAGPMQGDKDKDKEVVKKLGVGKLGDRVVGKEDFERLWDIYPRKDGRKKALSAFFGSVKSLSDLERVTRAVANYIAYIKKNNIENQFIKNGSTFFNNWEDWEVSNGTNDSASNLDLKALAKSAREAKNAREESTAGAVSTGVRDMPDVQSEDRGSD